MTALALIVPSLAQATVQRFDFTARVDETDATVPPGTPVTGRFSYDDASIPELVDPEDDSVLTIYGGSGFIISGSFLGNTRVANQGGIAYLFDGGNGGGDSFGILAVADDYLFRIFVNDPSGNLVAGTTLPSSFPMLAQGPFADPDDFDSLSVPAGAIRYSGDDNYLNATLLTITPAAAPEPAAWAMLAAGFGTLGALLRRRRPLAIAPAV